MEKTALPKIPGLEDVDSQALKEMMSNPVFAKVLAHVYQEGEASGFVKGATEAEHEASAEPAPRVEPIPGLDMQTFRDEGYETAQQIVQMCTMAGHADKAPAFLQKGFTVEQARTMLEEIKAHMAERDEILSMIEPHTQRTDEASQYIVHKLNYKDIYKKRNQKLVGIIES